MLKVHNPVAGESFTFSTHTVLWIHSGNGLAQVDFKIYPDLDSKMIFLSPGQHIKFLTGEFHIAILEFDEDVARSSRDYRVLFKHLISLGYIELPETPQPLLSLFRPGNERNILDTSAHRWYGQNPFRANKDEYAIIFDVKDVVDQNYNAQTGVDQVIEALQYSRHTVHKLVKYRVGLTIKDLQHRKLLTESQKAIALTDKPIREVAYDLGYTDPAYFNRFFKQRTALTPREFRQHFGEPHCDQFLQDLEALIRTYHTTHRSTGFYADKLHMSIPALSRRIRDRLQTTLGALVREEIIAHARRLLTEMHVKEAAHLLGFEEPNHFSTYFRKYTGTPPAAYQAQKSNS